MNSCGPDADLPPLFGEADHGRIVSSEEFASADFEEGWIYERVNGRLVVGPPNGMEFHLACEPFLMGLFCNKSFHRGIIQYIVSHAWVRIDQDNDRIADFAVYLVSDSPPPIPDRVPEILFEIICGTGRDRTRDYAIKRATYERLGVREYVLVNCFLRYVLVLENSPQGFRERRLTHSDRYETPLLPGLSVELSEVLPA
jgi:Uma2 family endonuclease